MPQPNNEFLAALIAGDVAAVRRIEAQVMPHLPPVSRSESEVSMHMVRTANERVPLKQRAYSYRWLQERGLPEQLPDRLKPAAERLYPRVAEAVGIAMSTSKKWLQPALNQVRGVMEAVVEDCFANGDRDPELMRDRMMLARDDEMRRLFAGVPQ